MRIARRSPSVRSAGRSGSLGISLSFLLCAAIGAGCGNDPAPSTTPAPVKESLPTTTSVAAENTGATPPTTPAEGPKAAADPATTAATPPANTPTEPGKAVEPGKAAAIAANPDPKLAAATAVPADVPTAAPTVTPTAAPAETAAPTVMSPKLAEQTFNLWMQSAGKYKVGQPGSVEVVLVAKGDYKCNDKYPFKFKLGAPPAGISYPQAVIPAGGMSIGKSRSSMRVPFTPSAVGDARISGKFSFSVCSDEKCVVESRELAVNVKVVE